MNDDCGRMPENVHLCLYSNKTPCIVHAMGILLCRKKDERHVKPVIPLMLTLTCPVSKNDDIQEPREPKMSDAHQDHACP